MRNQAVVVAGAALVTAAVIAVVAFVAFNTGARHRASPDAQTSPTARPAATATTTAQPAPTVTVTKRKTAPDRVAPQPYYYGDDEEFLATIARDGIRAPDDWAIKAGRATCGADDTFARNYLTDGGIYSYHVQTFLDDWIMTHGGC
jgi:hypothetical protein